MLKCDIFHVLTTIFLLTYKSKFLMYTKPDFHIVKIFKIYIHVYTSSLFHGVFDIDTNLSMAGQ